MDLESIMLIEINQTKEDKYHMISLICEIFTKETELIDIENRFGSCLG